jgi:hypothetical protein
LKDSIQFLKNGQPLQTSSGLDALKYKHHWQYVDKDTTVTYRTYTGNADYTFSGLNTATATIAGSNELQIDSKTVHTDSTVWRDFTISATLTNVKVNQTPSGWVQGCPSSGSISASVEMVYQKDTDDPVTTNWTVNVSFNDGHMSVVVNRGSTSWMYDTQVCTTSN